MSSISHSNRSLQLLAIIFVPFIKTTTIQQRVHSQTEQKASDRVTVRVSPDLHESIWGLSNNSSS
jgi:hypothetical protein